MDGGGGEFHDWELLQNSDETGSVNSSDSTENTRGFEDDTEGMIRTDYFSLDSHSRYMKTVDASEEEGSVESDNPSWIDPGSETRYPTKESAEFWPDSGSDRSDSHKSSQFDAKNELGVVENAKSQGGFEGIGETGAEGEDLVRFWSDSGRMGPVSKEFGGFEHQNEMVIDSCANSQDGSGLAAGEKGVEGFAAAGEGLSSGNESAVVGEVRKVGGQEKRSVVWWKLPFELLKCCAFRVSPVWTFSVAAAVIGFVILGRRFYKMKRKSQSLQLKVTLDDKKVSQFMNRAARLNEAFSVVKQVPVIRPPSLPAVGVTPWPVMSLR